MKKYIVPATICQSLVSNTFVCQITSVGGQEQGPGQPQLAPSKGNIIE